MFGKVLDIHGREKKTGRVDHVGSLVQRNLAHLEGHSTEQSIKSIIERNKEIDIK